MNDRPLLQIEKLVRRFQAGDQTVTILDGIDLCIHAGEMVAIIGSSGSGKSTLMNILGCLDRPSDGSYRIDGRETRSLDADALAELRREHFGFIFQRYHLLPHLDATDNTAMPAVYSGKEKTARQARASELLARLGLADRRHHQPGQLSGGQQQRVSIARALMNGGEVILADEPTGALDSRSGQEVLAILHELHALGHTIIMVTHDPQVAANAERIIEIRDGRILSDRANPQRPRQAAPPRLDPPPVADRGLRAGWGRFLEAFKMAGIAMASHKLRTLLTMLGIIIGITAVVSVVALGQGARQKVIDDISAMGTNTIDIFPGKDWGDRDAAGIRTLVPGDLTALQGQSYTDSATPSLNGSRVLRYRNLSVDAAINGVGEQYFRVKGLSMALGRPFNAGEVRHQAQVAVIDENTRSKLFSDGANPIGQVILVGDLPVRVIAVAADKESGFGPNDSLTVWVPYTAAMSRLFGQHYFSGITVRVRDGLSNAIAEQNILQLLTRRHGGKDIFTRSSDSILKTVEKTTSTLSLLISAIAVISLLVGGIGVMNIMLVSVTERTHEIGIRMAVGARQSDILQQFLIEAVLVCLLGGAIGILLSFGVGEVFSWFVSAMRMQFSISSIVAAVLCSSLIGVLFGYLPARNAARLDPIDALARE